MTAVSSKRALRACIADIYRARGDALRREFILARHCKGLVQEAGGRSGRGNAAVFRMLAGAAHRRKPPPRANVSKAGSLLGLPPPGDEPPDLRIDFLQRRLSAPHPLPATVYLPPPIAKPFVNAVKIQWNLEKIITRIGKILPTIEKILVTIGKILSTTGKILPAPGKIQLTLGKIQPTKGKILLTNGKIQLTKGKIIFTIGKILLIFRKKSLSRSKKLPGYHKNGPLSSPIIFTTACIHFKMEIIRHKLRKIIMTLERTLREARKTPILIPCIILVGRRLGLMFNL